MDAQKRIRQLIEERGWTDYRLAKEANLSHSTVTNMFSAYAADFRGGMQGVRYNTGAVFHGGWGISDDRRTAYPVLQMEYPYRRTTENPS